MDRKQKEQLRFFLKARKRAEKVLAERREAEQKKQDRKMRQEASQERMRQYSQDLILLAEESGLLAMAERAASERNGALKKQVSYYVDYGYSTNSLQKTVLPEEQGQLRASHLSLRITWGLPDALNEVEIRIHKSAQITFHNCILPLFPFIWRRNPQLLHRMFLRALEHPRQIAGPVKAAG